jgi:restriction endonuclease Mrr
MLIVLAAALLAPASAEAENLGRRLAAAGTLETMIPLLTAKEAGEIAAAHKELSDDERRLLLETGREVSGKMRTRLVAALGHEYAASLSIEDLRALVAAAETPAARRYREAVPGVTMRAIGGLGKVDFAAELSAAFCAKTGKLCAR